MHLHKIDPTNSKGGIIILQRNFEFFVNRENVIRVHVQLKTFQKFTGQRLFNLYLKNNADK